MVCERAAGLQTGKMPLGPTFMQSPPCRCLPPVSRAHLHSRSVTCDGHYRGDGLLRDIGTEMTGASGSGSTWKRPG